jgi:hypothetical protein
LNPNEFTVVPEMLRHRYGRLLLVAHPDQSGLVGRDLDEYSFKHRSSINGGRAAVFERHGQHR